MTIRPRLTLEEAIQGLEFLGHKVTNYYPDLMCAHSVFEIESPNGEYLTVEARELINIWMDIKARSL